ncbi:ABC transporter ATP-binding protein [Ferrimonas pelagia]|uniref:ABC transporter ATP-binding protein n=1 Tax=Ferrimonas pelagia TaxID=1177826 RepID=A0ABP9F650_9GAMM
MIINIENLFIRSEDQILVENLSLTVQSGRPMTILGETGSGKSLLANAIVGILPTGLSQEGLISLFGRADLSLAERQALWGREIAVLPQEPWLALNPIMPLQEQVREVGELVMGQSDDQSRRRSTSLLHKLGLAKDHAKIPSQLSGGMAQRGAFAAATYAGAQLLIADEPTKGLDASRRDQIGAMLKQHGQQGALLTITHDVQLAAQIGGDIMVMRQGQVLEQGSAQEVLNAPKSDYAKALINAQSDRWPLRAQRPTGENQLIVRGLSKQRGGKTLFRDWDFEVRRGEVLGLCGDSGCGKSTLADLLLGLVKADSGQIKATVPFGPQQCLKLYQDPPSAFAPGVTLGQLLEDLIRLHKLDRQPIGPLMQQLKLDPGLLARSASGVSGGELQRFAILRALLMQPKLLVADEPTSRLDPITAREVTELLVDAARSSGCTLLLISHDSGAMQRVCDRILQFTPDRPLLSEPLLGARAQQCA